jgi:hydroxypyruvate isomerase
MRGVLNMFELSACIEMLFETESPDFVSRLALAKDAGFKFKSLAYIRECVQAVG